MRDLIDCEDPSLRTVDHVDVKEGLRYTPTDGSRGAPLLLLSQLDPHEAPHVTIRLTASGIAATTMKGSPFDMDILPLRQLRMTTIRKNGDHSLALLWPEIADPSKNVTKSRSRTDDL